MKSLILTLTTCVLILGVVLPGLTPRKARVIAVPKVAA